MEKYSTVIEASKRIGISNTSISKVLRGERNMAGGFVWRKFSVEDNIPEIIKTTFEYNLANQDTFRGVDKITDKDIIK